jgi:hypothetical protein
MYVILGCSHQYGRNLNQLLYELDPPSRVNRKCPEQLCLSGPNLFFTRGLSPILSPKRNALLTGYHLSCFNASRLAKSMKHMIPSVAWVTTIIIRNSYIE